MKKIIPALFLSVLLSACSTTATTDTATPQNNTPSQQSTAPDLATQQIQAFEANQIKLHSQPVAN